MYLHLFNAIPLGIAASIRRSHRRDTGSIPVEGDYFSYEHIYTLLTKCMLAKYKIISCSQNSKLMWLTDLYT